MDGKEKRGSRRARTQNAINRQRKIIRDTHILSYTNHKLASQPHRMAKKHALDCGNSRCGVCGNPRQINKELTIQEKKFLEGIKKDG